MKLKIVKIVEIACTCLGGLLVIGFAFFIFQKLAFENKPIEVLGISIFEVNSNDLKDDNKKQSIDQGDLLITISKKKFKEGDIILFTDNNKYYVRKVLKFENNIVTTESHFFEGSEGESIELSNVLGKKVIVFNNYANFRQNALKPVTIIILGVLFFGGLIACFVLEKVFSNLDESKSKLENENKEI